METFGCIDILVNNAGGQDGPVVTKRPGLSVDIVALVEAYHKDGQY